MYISIIILLIIVIILKEIDERFNIRETSVGNLDINYKEKYEKKEYLLTTTELKFYKLLKTITDEMGYSLLCQISLYEIVKSKEQKDFNRIKSKSIDFVIVEKNCKIRLCIELDDKTHYNKNRVKRDMFINKLFSDLDIKLLRIPVQNFYNLEELKKKIEESL